MEKECFAKIKFSEQQIQEDFFNYRQNFEGKILEIQKNPPNKQELLSQVILKSIHAKREQKQTENQTEDLYEENDKDFIGRVLKEKGLLGKKLDQNTSNQIKQEIIYNHQNRYIERSIIINQRLQAEKENVLNKQKEFQRKTNENIGKVEEQKLEEDLCNFNLKLQILEQRLLNFQKNAYEKYQELENQLKDDPRLNSQ